jgi:hypothetical protein
MLFIQGIVAIPGQRATPTYSAVIPIPGHSWESSGICLAPASDQSTARRESELTGAHFRRSNDSKWQI